MDIVYLEWYDAFASGGGWYNRQQLKEEMLDVEHWVREIGFVIHEDDKCIVFAPTWLPEQPKVSDERFSALQKIPKTWIQKRITLATVEGDYRNSMIKITSSPDKEEAACLSQ